jgi:hypothetical protein
MPDDTNAMIQAGFVQPGQPQPQQPPQFVQAPQFVQQPPQPAPQFVQAPQEPVLNTSNTTANTNGATAITPTAVISGNNNNVDISSIIQDNSGGLSSIRVLMLLWGGGVFLIWSAAWIVGLYHGIYTAPTLPPEIVTILLGVSGIKTVQRFGER